MTTAGTPAGLAPALRALKLSGMLDTLEAPLAEARTGTLGPAALLHVLCEDQLARPDPRNGPRPIPPARLPAEAPLRDLHLSYHPHPPPPPRGEQLRAAPPVASAARGHTYAPRCAPARPVSRGPPPPRPAAGRRGPAPPTPPAPAAEAPAARRPGAARPAPPPPLGTRHD